MGDCVSIVYTEVVQCTARKAVTCVTGYAAELGCRSHVCSRAHGISLSIVQQLCCIAGCMTSDLLRFPPLPCGSMAKLHRLLVISTPHTQNSLGRSATVGAGALPLSRIFLASSASDAPEERALAENHASDGHGYTSVRKLVSFCLGVYGRE